MACMSKEEIRARSCCLVVVKCPCFCGGKETVFHIPWSINHCSTFSIILYIAMHSQIYDEWPGDEAMQKEERNVTSNLILKVDALQW